VRIAESRYRRGAIGRRRRRVAGVVTSPTQIASSVACTCLRFRTVRIGVPVVWLSSRFICSTAKAARSRRKNRMCRRLASTPSRYGRPRRERRGRCHFEMNRMKETPTTKISRSPTHHRVRNFRT
jgi:hypothetical protein